MNDHCTICDDDEFMGNVITDFWVLFGNTGDAGDAWCTIMLFCCVCCRLIEPVDRPALNLPIAPEDPSSAVGPCECGRMRLDVVTVTPPDVIFVDGMPYLLWPVMMTLLLNGGTGVTKWGPVAVPFNCAKFPLLELFWMLLWLFARFEPFWFICCDELKRVMLLCKPPTEPPEMGKGHCFPSDTQTNSMGNISIIISYQQYSISSCFDVCYRLNAIVRCCVNPRI